MTKEKSEKENAPEETRQEASQAAQTSALGERPAQKKSEGSGEKTKASTGVQYVDRTGAWEVQVVRRGEGDADELAKLKEQGFEVYESNRRFIRVRKPYEKQ